VYDYGQTRGETSRVWRGFLLKVGFEMSRGLMQGR
jgi:hypothetical protein